MAYDPAWDMPQTNWLQQGSFESGEIPPAVEPDAGTQICIGPIAQEWLPVVLGALDQLRNPSTWIVADDAAMDTVLRRVDKLREIIAVSEGCVPPVEMRLTADCVLQYSNDGGATWTDTTDWIANFPGCVRDNIPPVVPVNPPDNPPGQEACNIAWYLAEAILQKALQQRATDRTANNSVSNSVANIINAVFNNNPFIDFLTQAANYLVQTTNPQTAADVAAASTDAGLLAAIAEAIFSAINVQGYVTAANFSQVATNIAAISYPAHSWVPTMMANFWNNLGLAVIKQMQSEGSVTDGDCSAFGTTWCYYWDFTANDGGWTPWPGFPGTYVGGVGWEGQLSAGQQAIDIAVNLPGPATITEMQATIAMKHTQRQTASSGFYIDASVGGGQIAHSLGISVPTTWPGGTWVSGALAGTGGCVELAFSSDWGGSNGDLVIIGVQIRGTGVNPFRVPIPCVVGP